MATNDVVPESCVLREPPCNNSPFPTIPCRHRLLYRDIWPLVPFRLSSDFLLLMLWNEIAWLEIFLQHTCTTAGGCVPVASCQIKFRSLVISYCCVLRSHTHTSPTMYNTSSFVSRQTKEPSSGRRSSVESHCPLLACLSHAHPYRMNQVRGEWNRFKERKEGTAPCVVYVSTISGTELNQGFLNPFLLLVWFKFWGTLNGATDTIRYVQRCHYNER